MYEICVYLSNRVERIPFCSLYAANCFVVDKRLFECADVEKVIIIDTETGEIMAEWL